MLRGVVAQLVGQLGVSVCAYGASLSWSCEESWTVNSLGTSRLSRDISLASASSSRCSRAAISTGCTSPLNARAKTPFTAPSTFFSKRWRIPNVPPLPPVHPDLVDPARSDDCSRAQPGGAAWCVGPAGGAARTVGERGARGVGPC